MSDFSKELSVAKEIAHKAGVTMRQYFRTENGVEHKKDGSPVTIADKAINHMVIEELGKHFDDRVVGEEESTGEYGAGRRWICDPIDGTKAYIWGVPTAMFSLGFVVEGVPTVAVAYDPFLDALYEAVKGGGSFCNAEPLKVSKEGLSGGYVALNSRPDEIIRYASCSEYLSSKGAHPTAFSSAVYKMMLVARGSFIGAIEWGVNPHDAAAGHLIIEEAGGNVTGLHGETLNYMKPFKGAISSNSVVHEELLLSLKKTIGK